MIIDFAWLDCLKNSIFEDKHQKQSTMENSSEQIKAQIEADDKPPVFKTWNQTYIFVLILHAVIIACFYFLTHAYA